MSPPEPKPFYSIALVRRNLGKPQDAVVEIRRQLARFPNDFEGIMLLARIQAEDFMDLSGAEETLRHFCDSPAAPATQIAVAHTQLADWHLKITGDAEAARAALRLLITRFPDTEIALQAGQRITHLSETEKMTAQRGWPAIALPAGARNVGLLDSTEFLRPKEMEPEAAEVACLKQLEERPHDTETREKLAVLYAREFKRLDLASVELAQLINEPKHKPKQIAQWLNLLANLQVELGADITTVRATSETIVSVFPSCR